MSASFLGVWGKREDRRSGREKKGRAGQGRAGQGREEVSVEQEG